MCLDLGKLGSDKVVPEAENGGWARIQPRREVRASKRKQMKINGSKSACICFHLLTFIFSNRAFSRAYEAEKQKNYFCSRRAPQVVRTARQLSLSGSPGGRRAKSSSTNIIITFSVFAKIMSEKFDARPANLTLVPPRFGRSTQAKKGRGGRSPSDCRRGCHTAGAWPARKPRKAAIDPLLRSAGLSYGSRAIGVGGLRHSAASYEHVSAQSRRHVETLREALRSESWEPKGLSPRDEKAQDQDPAPLFRAEP
jgi:hypothetical protein